MSESIKALRALVEAMEHFCKDEESVAWEILFDHLLPAAREALERVEAYSPWPTYKEDMKTVKQEHWLRVQALTARIAELEKALRRVRTIVSPAIVGQHECDVIDAALEGRPHDADTAEWQRVHGAAAQAARDVAHWRTRAEHAEARLAQLEGRDE